MTLPTTPLTPGSTPSAQPAVRTDLFSLSTGTITITWPIDLGDATPEDVKAWLDLMSAKIGKVAKAAHGTVSKPDVEPQQTGGARHR